MTDDRVALRRFVPAELDEDQRALYDTIVSGPRGRGAQRFRLFDADGRLEGPFNAFLLQPVLGDRLQALGSAIRYSTSLSDRAREIAVLVVAAHWQSAFEQSAHEAVGRAAGLTDDELNSIRSGLDPDADPTWTEPADRLIVRLAQSFVRDGDADDATYAAGVELVGESGIFELLTLVGYYAMLALQLRVFRVAPPNGNVP